LDEDTGENPGGPERVLLLVSFLILGRKRLGLALLKYQYCQMTPKDTIAFEGSFCDDFFITCFHLYRWKSNHSFV